MYSRVGVPEEVLNDLGMQFTSDCMKEVSRLLFIRRLTTSPYHRACNGLVKKCNGTLKQMLRKQCHEQPRQWHRFINPLLFAYWEARQEATGFSPSELLYGRIVRGPVQILKELWSEEGNVPEVTTSHQYVLKLRERLDETMRLAEAELEKNLIRNKKLYNRKTKKRVVQERDKVLALFPTDHNKLLMHWKGPFKVKGCKEGNNYQIEVNQKMKTFYINLLKRYVERDNVEMTATPGRRDFPGGIREETRVGTGIEVQGVQGDRLLAAAVGEIGKNVVGANANYVKEQEDVRVDDEKSLELGVLRPKESICDVCLEVELSREQHYEIMGVLSKREEIFTDIPGKTSIIKQ